MAPGLRFKVALENLALSLRPSADQLCNSPLWSLLYALRAVDDLPIFKPPHQLPPPQEKIGVMRSSKPWLLHGKGFIDEGTALFDRLFDTGNEGSVQVTKYQNARKKIFR